MANIDGAAKQGKTEGKNPKTDGPSVKTQSVGRSSKGVTTDAMKDVGRNMAKANYQKGGK